MRQEARADCPQGGRWCRRLGPQQPSVGDLGLLIREPGAGVPSLHPWHLLQALGLDLGGKRTHGEQLLGPERWYMLPFYYPQGTREPCFIDVDCEAQRGCAAIARGPQPAMCGLCSLYHVPSEAPDGPIFPGSCPPPDQAAWSSKVHARLLAAHSTALSSSFPSKTLSSGTPGLWNLPWFPTACPAWPSGWRLPLSQIIRAGRDCGLRDPYRWEQ